MKKSRGAFYLHRKYSITNFDVFRKLYINYTSILTEDNEELLTFGILGRVFHLDEFEDSNDDVEAPALLHLLISLAVGVLTMILIVKLFRF